MLEEMLPTKWGTTNWKGNGLQILEKTRKDCRAVWSVIVSLLIVLLFIIWKDLTGSMCLVFRWPTQATMYRPTNHKALS